MRRRALTIGFLVGTAIGMVSVVASGANERPTTGAELLSRLEAAASSGDSKAAAHLAALVDLMARRHLDPAALPMPEDKVRERAVAGVRVQVVDSAPWYVKVRNVTQIADAQSLERYRADRHVALAELAFDAPAASIEVVVAPSGSMPIARLAALLDCTCPGELIVDVYAHGMWLMTAGRLVDGADLDDDGTGAETAILGQVEASLDLFPGIAATDLAIAVRSMRTSLSAEEAVRLSREPDVFAVDPLTDLARGETGRAAIVELGRGPDLRELHARLVLDAPVDANQLMPVDGGAG